MILPAAHYGRDGLVAVALVAQMMSAGGTLREHASALPRYAMIKDKLARPEQPWETTEKRLREAFAGWSLDTADGLRFARDEEWVHVRASGTEPVVRVIAEAPGMDGAKALVETSRRALSA
jgi:phosphomannomutase